jgi:hypothetical protein
VPSWELAATIISRVVMERPDRGRTCASVAPVRVISESSWASLLPANTTELYLRSTAVSGIIRVLIADDHPVVCLGLLGIINGQRDMTVVGQARSGSEVVALARKHSPDVILMDYEYRV